MKKFSIALLSMLLAGTMLLTGCGGDSGKQSADSGSSDQQQSEQQPDTNNTDNTNTSGDTANDNTASGGTLRMGTNAAFPPYEFMDENNEVSGIDAEIANAIAGKLGMELDITDMAFESLTSALQGGSIDVILAGMTVTPERLEAVSFSDSYATGVQVVIVPDGSDITKIEDLNGRNIGVQTGTTGDLYCTESYGQDRVKQFDNGALAVAALNNGQVDCVVIDNEPAKAFVAANDGLKILDTEYAVEDYAIAVAKENTVLLEKINVAIKELKDDGTIASIIEKYIPSEG